MQLELALRSEAGGRRRNEDACGHWHDGRHVCCVLADGAGGHGGGDVASRLVVEHVLAQYAAAPAHAPDALHALLCSAHAAVVARQVRGTATADMHTTAVVLSVDLADGSALWAHCGDSRLYAFRSGRVQRHTHDHSLVQSLVDAGLLPADQVRGHPRRSALYAALGVRGTLDVLDVADAPCPLQPGDVLMLCSDGLWECVDEPTMESTLAAACGPQDWLQRLAEAAAAAHDNVSALAVWLRAGDC